MPVVPSHRLPLAQGPGYSAHPLVMELPHQGLRPRAERDNVGQEGEEAEEVDLGASSPSYVHLCGGQNMSLPFKMGWGDPFHPESPWLPKILLPHLQGGP